MKYMLETSVCVSLIRGQASATGLPAASECVLSTITVAELEVGVRRSVRPAAQRKAVDAFTEIFEVLAWDLQATSYYGDLRVDLEKRGTVRCARHAHRGPCSPTWGDPRDRQFPRVSARGRSTVLGMETIRRRREAVTGVRASSGW